MTTSKGFVVFLEGDSEALTMPARNDETVHLCIQERALILDQAEVESILTQWARLDYNKRKYARSDKHDYAVAEFTDRGLQIGVWSEVMDNMYRAIAAPDMLNVSFFAEVL